MRLVCVLKELLLCQTKSKDRMEELQRYSFVCSCFLVDIKGAAVYMWWIFFMLEIKHIKQWCSSMLNFKFINSMTVNLLTNVPSDCYEELLTPLNEDDDDIGLENKEAEYDGKNMEAILVLLEFLNRRLDKVC